MLEPVARVIRRDQVDEQSWFFAPNFDRTAVDDGERVSLFETTPGLSSINVRVTQVSRRMIFDSIRSAKTPSVL